MPAYLVRVDSDFEDVVDQRYKRRKRERGHKQSDKSKLNDELQILSEGKAGGRHGV